MNLNDLKTCVESTLNELDIEAKDGKILENVTSLQLVRLTLALEEKIELGTSIVSDAVFSRTKSPFLTVDSLAEYLFLLRERHA
jgi:acyl carrier protein